MLAADSGEALGYFLVVLQAFSSLLGYFILNHYRERCFLLYFKQSECCACRLPKPCISKPHSSFDLNEFHWSHRDQSVALPLACSSAAVGTAIAHVRALCWVQPCLTVVSSGTAMQKGKAVRMEAKSTEISWNG